MVRRLSLVCAVSALAASALSVPAPASATVPQARAAQPSAVPEDPAGLPGKPKTRNVRLLALNDFHGNLEPPSGSAGKVIDENGNSVDAGGAAYMATHLKKYRNKNTAVVAQGDLIGGSPLISAAYHDEPSVDFLGKVGVKAAAVGNHEFDEGYKELLRIQNGGCHPKDGCSPAGKWKGAKFQYLAGNVIKEKTGKPVLPSYEIRKINGVKVGFIGVVTRTTPTIVTSEGVKGLKFIKEVKAANAAAKKLRKKGVKAMALLVHEGDMTPPTQKPDDCNVTPGAGYEIAKNADADIDMVLAGHSHQQYICSVKDPKGKPRLYAQGSSFSKVITQVDFKVKKKKRVTDVVRSSVKADNHVVTRDVKPDPEIEKFVATWKERVAPIANRKIGQITADIDRKATAAGETPLGDMIADAQLASMKDKGAQAAVMNPGGVRADLVHKASGSEGDGVVTYGEAFTVQPFSNVMGVVSLDGKQVDKLLEQQFTAAGEKILQPSASLKFKIDRSKPIGDRVSGITIDGKAVEDATTYKIAANSFLLGGGDGFTVFTEGKDRVNGPMDLDALEAFFTKNSPVAPPKTDRITGQ